MSDILSREMFGQHLSTFTAENEPLRYALITVLEAHDAALRSRIAELEERLAKAEGERDAYKRAKAENDDRFMVERDEALAERDAARTTIERLRHYADHTESCDWRWLRGDCSCGYAAVLALGGMPKEIRPAPRNRS